MGPWILLLTLFASVAYAEENDSELIHFPILNEKQVSRRKRRELKLLDSSTNKKDDFTSTVSRSSQSSFLMSFDGDELEDMFRYKHSALVYQGFGTHYVDLWVGHPDPQRQTLIVDTGSSTVGFPCEPCPQCGGEKYHTDPSYKEKDSETFQVISCTDCKMGRCTSETRIHSTEKDFKYCKLSRGYSEGSSWKAYEAKDLCYIGGPHDEPLIVRRYQDLRRRKRKRTLSNPVIESTATLEAAFKAKALELEEKYGSKSALALYAAKDSTFELRFGCQYEVTGLFQKQLADGICGMGNSPLSFWRQMHDAGKIKRKAFSLCFTKGIADRNGFQAGIMTLGGADKRLHDTSIVYAEIIDSSGWYTIYINGIYLKYENGDDLENIIKVDVDLEKLNGDGIILDSGSTKSYLSPDLLDPFQNAFSKLMGFEFMTSISENEDKKTIKDYPTILVQLKGAVNVARDDLYDREGQPLFGLSNALDPLSPKDVVLEILPENYMTYRSKDQTYINGFNMNDRELSGILGSNSFYGYDILFDVDGQRIGFAKSNCNFERIKNIQPVN